MVKRPHGKNFFLLFSTIRFRFSKWLIFSWNFERSILHSYIVLPWYDLRDWPRVKNKISTFNLTACASKCTDNKSLVIIHSTAAKALTFMCCLKVWCKCWLLQKTAIRRHRKVILLYLLSVRWSDQHTATTISAQSHLKDKQTLNQSYAIHYIHIVQSTSSTYFIFRHDGHQSLSILWTCLQGKMDF